MNDCVHGRKHGRVHDRVRVHVHRVRVMDGPCTWPIHGRVHSLYMAVDGRIHGPQTRPCTGYATVYMLAYPVHGRVCGPRTGPPMYRLHDQGRVQTVDTTVHEPCTWSVHDPNTAVYGCAPCRRMYLQPVYAAEYGPRTRLCLEPVYMAVNRVHGRVCGKCTRPFTAVSPCTDRVHGR